MGADPVQTEVNVGGGAQRAAGHRGWRSGGPALREGVVFTPSLSLV